MIMPEKSPGITPCPYCGYAVGLGEWLVRVGKLTYHIECAEAHPNIDVDWDRFHRLIDYGEI